MINSYEELLDQTYHIYIPDNGEIILEVNRKYIETDENDDFPLGYAYCVDIIINNELYTTYNVFRSGDGGLSSKLANGRRHNMYKLTLAVAEFIKNQLDLLKERSNSKCSIIIRDNFPSGIKQIKEDE